MPKVEIDTFTQAYIDAALWSTNDESTPQGGEPLDKNYSQDNIDPETIKKMVEDCRKFQEDNAEHITEENYIGSAQYDADEMAGHDFWLTRNGHGAGFWDGDWADGADDILTDAANSYGEFYLYVGDDEIIYGN